MSRAYLVPNRVTMAREVLELTADYARHCADTKTPQTRMEGVACLCEILGEFLKDAEPLAEEEAASPSPAAAR